MKKGTLKVSKTNKGKIFVEIDRHNGKPPMPVSYVVFSDTSLNGKECTYENDDQGRVASISVAGKVVWSKSEFLGKSQNSGDSFNLNQTFLPRDVRDKEIADIDNFALKLQKAARYEAQKDNYKFTFFKHDQRERISFKINANYGHLKDHFDTLCRRQTQTVELLHPGNNKKVTLSAQWRLILGLGGESVYETNMTLHHLYGIPYLPSSSIKGVLRSWIISQVFADPGNVPNNEKKHPLINAEARAISGNKLFCTIFGCPEKIKMVVFDNNGNPVKKNKSDWEEKEFKSALGADNQGIAVFFDGFPTVPPVVKTDVMNVHYKDWYKEQGFKAPTDTQRTNPIHFLTVSNENNLKFQTHIAVLKDQVKLKEISDDFGAFIKGTNMTADTSLVDLLEYWLNKALSEHGIGAKTAVGYGLLK